MNMNREYTIIRAFQSKIYKAYILVGLFLKIGQDLRWIRL